MSSENEIRKQISVVCSSFSIMWMNIKQSLISRNLFLLSKAQ